MCLAQVKRHRKTVLQNSAMQNELIVYGIPNCDAVKKSRVWLDAQGKAYRFHDFKKEGVPDIALDLWVNALGWEALINKKGTTWRKLNPAAQEAVIDAQSAMRLMQEEPSVIKRPVVMHADWVTVGYTPEKW